MGRGRPRKESSVKPCVKTISKQEKRDLRTLADDFYLLDEEGVREIIENCESYAQGQRAIMRVYVKMYLR